MVDERALVLVYATFPDMQTAQRVGGTLVDRRLAACVNIIPHMVSIYRWENEIETANEVVMIIKTCETQAGKVIEKTRELHPYDTPAILVLPITGGLDDFVSWLREETEQNNHARC